MPETPIDPRLFEWPAATPSLIGSSCRVCGVTTFPQQATCPRCSTDTMETRGLPTSGTLWSFTVQSFAPKAPYLAANNFVPYGVGYVNLGGEVLVEGRLKESDPAELRIGTPMHLVFERLTRTDEADVVTYAFARSG